MNDSKHREERLEVGEGMNIDGPPPPSCMPGSSGGGGGGRTVPAIQVSVICSASEGGETMLVTVGDRDSWLSH